MPARTESPEGLLSLLKQLHRHLAPRRKRQILVALLLMLGSGVLEMLSVGAVPPLLVGLLRWGNQIPAQTVGLFCVLVVSAAGVRWFSLQVQLRLAGAVGSDLASAALERLLSAPYASQLRRDQAATLAMLAPQQRQLVHQVLQPLLLLCSGSILAGGVVLVLVALAWRLVFPVLALVGLSYAAIHRLTSTQLRRSGDQAIRLQRGLIRQLHTTFATTRDMVLRNWQPLIVQSFASGDRRMRQLEASNAALSGLPRYVVEPAAILAITATGAVMLQAGQSTEQVLPALGLMAFAAQRLLPLSQQIWSSWCGLISSRALLEPLLEVLAMPTPSPLPPAKPLLGWQSCALHNVSFGYGSERQVLQHFNLTLSRGEWVALQGPSGCGKSTTLDLLLGLLEPSAGDLRVNGVPITHQPEQLRRWQAAAAHASATVPLIPGTVHSNLSLGMGECNPEALRQAVEVTGIGDLLQRSISDGQTELSSGQRQRVGIARALLRPIALLILDEATGGLDLPTETELLSKLRRTYPTLTVVLVSHRDSTLKHCDRVVQLRAGHAESR